eukprot:g39500.t1
MREENSTDDVPEKELWAGTRVGLEQGMFHKPSKETGITGAHAGIYCYPSDLKKMRRVKREVIQSEDMFGQAEEGGDGLGQFGPFVRQELESLETILIGDGHERGLYIHSKEE